MPREHKEPREGNAGKYQLAVPIENPNGGTFWQRIGYGNTYDTSNGRVAIACTMNVVPLNWNGEFHLFPKD